MKKKFNPFTGTLDFVGEDGAVTSLGWELLTKAVASPIDFELLFDQNGNALVELT